MIRASRLEMLARANRWLLLPTPEYSSASLYKRTLRVFVPCRHGSLFPEDLDRISWLSPSDGKSHARIIGKLIALGCSPLVSGQETALLLPENADPAIRLVRPRRRRGKSCAAISVLTRFQNTP